MTRFLTKKCSGIAPSGNNSESFFYKWKSSAAAKEYTLFFSLFNNINERAIELFCTHMRPSQPAQSSLYYIRLLCAYTVIWVFNTGLSLDSTWTSITVILNNSTFRPQCSFLFWAHIAVFCLLTPLRLSYTPQISQCIHKLLCFATAGYNAGME